MYVDIHHAVVFSSHNKIKTCLRFLSDKVVISFILFYKFNTKKIDFRFDVFAIALFTESTDFKKSKKKLIIKFFDITF